MCVHEVWLVMTSSPRRVKGSVKILSCKACDSDFPIFDFEFENDADGIGLGSAGLCDRKSLLLIEFNIEEWEAVCVGNLRILPSRFRPMVGNADYRLAHVLRVERQVLPKAGTSFEKFLRLYKAATVFYSCPCCAKGEVVARSEITIDEYIKSGGQVTALDPLFLAREANTGDT
jgi:hypothetical protein